jgi:hypothetical protein
MYGEFDGTFGVEVRTRDGERPNHFPEADHPKVLIDQHNIKRE